MLEVYIFMVSHSTYWWWLGEAGRNSENGRKGRVIDNNWIQSDHALVFSEEEYKSLDVTE